MANRFSVHQKILIVAFIGVIVFGVFMCLTSAPTLKQHQLVEGMDSIDNTQQNPSCDLLKDVHYGYVSLDSIKILTKQLPGFNNSQRISSNRITSKASINVKGYEYQFLGKDDGVQWRNAYKKELEEEGIYYDEKERLLTMKYDKGYVLIPYQILMQLTLVVDKNNNDNNVK